MGRLPLLIAFLAAGTVAADWSTLDRFQQTITRAEFDRLLFTVYSPDRAITNYLTYTANSVTIDGQFELRFATNAPGQSATRPARPRIVLDPGHIGGEWARMEERFFVRGHDRPVQEAILNLTVARLLKARLESAGFTVLLSKDNFEPVTLKRPEDFRAEAERLIPDFAAYPEHERTAARADALRKRMELLFYRNAEITARAEHINQDLAPDLTLCLHFNAVEWNERQDLVEDNRLLIFVHGNYLPREVADDQQRLRLFQKLLAGTIDRELPVAEAVVDALAKATGLPPVQYGPKSGAIRVGPNPYVYARNLAANRLINGPVIFLEPYYMNNRIVYHRIQLGDYDGTKEIEGRPYPSIFREYADAVAAGLISVFPRAP